MIEKVELENLKTKVFDYYSSNKKLCSPIFWYVKLTPQSLWHLENKDKKHKRSMDEVLIRYKCFLLIDKIIKKSFLYQEYKQEIEDVFVKRKWKKVKINSKVKYFGLIWIIEAYKWHWIRIKIVIKKVSNRNYEFVSVIPAWNMRWYHRLYFDERL